MEEAQTQENEQRQGAHDQETRQRILKAAERLFLERGFKGVSMKDIAEEVHVTSAALYYHFPEGKQELFLNMVKMLYEEWYANTKRIIAEASTLEDRLTRIAEYLMASAQKYQSTFAGLRRDIERYGSKHKQELFQARPHQAMEQIMTNVFQQGIDRGEINADVPAFVLARIYGGALGGMQFSRMHSPAEDDSLDTKAYVSMLVSTLLDGIRRPKEKSH